MSITVIEGRDSEDSLLALTLRARDPHLALDPRGVSIQLQSVAKR